LRIGGWDSLRRAHPPLKNAVAPGTTMFCEVEKSVTLRNEIADGLLHVGAMTTSGFGLCAAGVTPDWKRTR